jgi:hypothetical protein
MEAPSRPLKPGWVRRPGYCLSLAPQGSPEWLRLRVGRVTASAAAAAAGYSDWGLNNKESNELLARRLCGLSTGPHHVTDAMRDGLAMEPAMRSWFQRVYMRVKQGRVVDVREVGLAVPEHHPWIGVSLDGEVFDLDGWGQFGAGDARATSTENVEFKRTRQLSYALVQRMQPGYDLRLKTLPKDHYFQMQLGMHVTRKLACWYVVWPREGPNEPYVERVPYDRDFCLRLMDDLKGFYDAYIGPLQFNDPLLLPVSPFKEEEE